MIISNVSISANSFAVGEAGTITFTVKNNSGWMAKTIEAKLARVPQHASSEIVSVLPETTISLANNASKTYTRTFTVTSAIQGSLDYYGERAFVANLLITLTDGGGFNGQADLEYASTGAYLIDFHYIPSIPVFIVERTPNADSTDAAVDLTCTLAEGADPEYEDLALTLKWKEEDAASFPAGNTLAVTVADALDAGGTTVTPSFTFETGKAYTLRATFTDGIDSAVSEAKLSKAFKVLNVHPTSKNIGEGQFAVADTSAGLVHDTMYRYRFGAGAEDADGREIIGKVDYSTTAVDTGIKWTDGKTIYRKVLTFTSMGNSATKDVSTGESAIAEVVHIRGMFKPTGETARAPIPWVHQATIGYQFRMTVESLTSNPYVRLLTGASQSCDSGFVVIEYTLPTT